MNERWHYGPIWIDPNFYRYPGRDPWVWKIAPDVGKPHPYSSPQRIAPAPLDEERVREIVRKEIADLPIPFDVPDAPPEGTPS
jgi:hypothetical protein